KEWTDEVPAIVEAMLALPVKAVTLDGEGVVIDERGVTDFEQLRAALAGRGGSRAAFLYALRYAWRTKDNFRNCPTVMRRNRSNPRRLQRRRVCSNSSCVRVRAGGQSSATSRPRLLRGPASSRARHRRRSAIAERWRRRRPIGVGRWARVRRWRGPLGGRWRRGGALGGCRWGP